MPHPLDNPIYQALNSKDQDKNSGNSTVSYFPPEIAPFIGLPQWDEDHQHQLIAQAPHDRNWFIIHAGTIKLLPELEVKFTIPLFQMTCPKLTPWPSSIIQPQALNADHVEEMIALATLTKPGPFASRTIEFGNYHGYFEEGRLAAMGGERLHLEGYSEISAICTHPDFRGKGYGAQLVHFLSLQIRDKGLTPFLHVRIDNKAAIAIYERLGFVKRKRMFFAIVRVKQGAVEST
jgi:ribosomal protein S18 acetylase RimI-like enzyme